jgi:hypothetical protein
VSDSALDLEFLDGVEDARLTLEALAAFADAAIRKLAPLAEAYADVMRGAAADDEAIIGAVTGWHRVDRQLRRASDAMRILTEGGSETEALAALHRPD